ncbi:MAG: ABC transporter permease subunit [Pirellulales bacterium]|nr:ABC transporter permease subunit [Pirellulales bacterium]
MAKNKSSSRKAKIHDRLARWAITLGGVAVIAGVIAILLMIVSVTLPMFGNPDVEPLGACRLPSASSVPDVLELGIDLDIRGAGGAVFVWFGDGRVDCLDIQTGELRAEQRISPPDGSEGSALIAAESIGANRFWLAWSDGAVKLVELDHTDARGAAAGLSSSESGTAGRTSSGAPGTLTCRTLAELPGLKNSNPTLVVARRSEDGTITRAALLPEGRIRVRRLSAAEDLFGDVEVETHESEIGDEVVRDVVAMTMDGPGDAIYAGSDDGRLVRWQLDGQGRVDGREVVNAFKDRRAVTDLAVALGDVSLVVGDERGGLTAWFAVRADETRKMRLIHDLGGEGGPVRRIVPSRRSKSVLSLNANGLMRLDHLTSERKLAAINADPPLRKIALGERGDAAAALDASGGLNVWWIGGGCPEISLKTLFGKVHYEGYDEPAYVWQTTGGADFEAKFSLVPLLFGTLKGTFYAMIFAAPLALAAAAYVSYFTTPALRGLIKPTVEIMATVPSVVIGFLIALWLAPIVKQGALAFFISMVSIPAAFVAFMSLWQLVRRINWVKRAENGFEFIVLVPVLVVGVLAAVWLARPVEARLFDGNFLQWLFDGPLGMKYEQSNCIIIAFGLGFTVIPLIFSIAEDSLSNVPYSMTAASMAVGASRWQTLRYIILPSASPGIFAAVMIGFGRAVGETMIVLMATGNTPIIDWSPLNGMLTLSANIAVEIPEAPVGGTLYRVLFLCAVLLFILTFIVNTAAEVVRQNLRNRFGKF